MQDANHKKPKETTIYYDPAPEYNNMEILSQLSLDQFKSSEMITKIVKSAMRVLVELGPLCAYHYLKHSILGYSFEDKSNVLYAIEPSDNLENCKDELVSDGNILNYKKDYESIIETAKELFTKNKSTEFHGLNLTEENYLFYSPKIYKLIQFLLNHHHEQTRFKCILFTETRSTAIGLCQLIKNATVLSFIKPDLLLGHGRKQHIGMDYKAQNKIISKFKNEEINMIIATKVAEEGLDLPNCNVIIRFDPILCVISYIQSRGRARHEESLYVVFELKGEGIVQSTLPQLQKKELELKKWCDLPPEQRNGHIVDPNSSDLYNDMKFINQETGAIISLDSSVSLINYFCSLLPKDDFSSNQPFFEYNENQNVYSCEMTLPSSCSLNNRLYTAESKFGKSIPKRIVCFLACKNLYEMGLLNENFLPKKKKQVRAITTDPIQFVKKKSQTITYTYNPPKFWSNFIQNTGAVYIIHSQGAEETDPSMKLAMIFSKSIIDAEKMNPFIKTELYNVELVFLYTRKFSESEIDILNSFTDKMLALLFKKEFKRTQKKVWGFIAPICENDIDFALASTFDESEEFIKSDINVGKNSVIKNMLYAKSVFKVIEICEDKTPLSIIPDCSKQNITFLEFFDKIQSNKNLTTSRKISDYNQKILKCIKLSSKLNYNRKDHLTNKQNISRPFYLVPELSKKLEIPYCLVQSLLFVPSILISIDSMLLINDIVETHQLYSLDKILALEAFTLPSANLKSNYQRLEFLGDSFLKLFASYFLFKNHPNFHEGILTMLRTFIISNEYLCKLFEEKQLWNYVNFKTFNRKRWLPVGYNYTEETIHDEKYNTFNMSLKQRADIIESFLAATLLSLGEESTFQFAHNFGFTKQLFESKFYKKEETKPKQINELKDLGSIPETKRLKVAHLIDIDAIQKLMEYQFKNPQLLVEALTHPSHNHLTTCSYQRLEFLGDSILDYFTTMHIFTKYNLADPETLHRIKKAFVCNSSLAVVCVTHSLHKHILHLSPDLSYKITKYAEELKELENNNVLNFENWDRLDPPKPLADIIEALFGAIYVDSKRSWDLTRAAHETIFLNFLQKKIDTSKLKDPKSDLYHRLNTEGCRGMKIKTKSIINKKEVVGYETVIFIHDKAVESYIDKNSKESINMAITNLNRKLEDGTFNIKLDCGCIGNK